VLDQVGAVLGAGVIISLLGDRGFLHQRLIEYARQHHWHYRLPMTGDTLQVLSSKF
jgi:hypothetical protein